MLQTLFPKFDKLSFCPYYAHTPRQYTVTLIRTGVLHTAVTNEKFCALNVFALFTAHVLISAHQMMNYEKHVPTRTLSIRDLRVLHLFCHLNVLVGVL